MLTGGRSAGLLYSQWSMNTSAIKCLRCMNLFIGDERCVSTKNHDSNYRMIRETLFRGQRIHSYNLHRLDAGAADLDLSARSYESILPESIDIMILSIGEDGHIASLFPDSPALLVTNRKVVPVVGPKAPFRRLTITPPVIQSAKQVYVLAIGEEKRRKYEEALQDPDDINSMPARLVLDRTWIFDLDEGINLCPKF